MRVLGLDRRDVHSAIRATLCVSVFVARRTVRGFRHPNAAMTASRRLGRISLDAARRASATTQSNIIAAMSRRSEILGPGQERPSTGGVRQ